MRRLEKSLKSLLSVAPIAGGGTRRSTNRVSVSIFVTENTAEFKIQPQVELMLDLFFLGDRPTLVAGCETSVLQCLPVIAHPFFDCTQFEYSEYKH